MNAHLTRRTNTVILGALLACLSYVTVSDGCCMAPLDWKGDLGQRGQRGLILHRDGVQDLLLEIKPHFDGTEGAPPYMAWVVTVPSTPLAYAAQAVSPIDDARELSKRVQRLAKSQWNARSRIDPVYLSNMFSNMLGIADSTVAMSAAAKGALDIGEATQVGPYNITPVHAEGTAGVRALNGYLDENGFPAEDENELRWFAERDFTFLCIRISPPAATNKLASDPELPPLAIRFESDRPYYPAKYSARQGNFGLELVVCTDEPLAKASIAQTRSRLRTGSRSHDNPWITSRGFGDIETGLDKLDGPDKWFINRFYSYGFNKPDETGALPIHSWTDDVFLEVGADDDAIGSWYYGDRPISALDRTWRESRYGIAVCVLLAFLLFRLIRRIMRKRAPVAA